MSKINSQFEEVREAVKAARSVDRSHAGHHKTVMELMAACAKPDAPFLTMLSEYGINRIQESPESLCTQATIKWLEVNFGIRITKEGEAKRGREFDAKGFTVETFEAARQKPWYDLAKEMAFKVPTAISWAAAASTALKVAYAEGSAIPTAEEVYAEFMGEVEKLKKGTGFAKWKAEFDKRKGEEGPTDIVEPVAAPANTEVVKAPAEKPMQEAQAA